ncbi:uncharacterized protein LOC135466640 [Liolophura sinensis]|uniref:uncharacterized protein LOC135466640 n=1 Tax=Liolophura sinensis TaxID=3198878 RepID=UPI0031594D5D
MATNRGSGKLDDWDGGHLDGNHDGKVRQTSSGRPRADSHGNLHLQSGAGSGRAVDAGDRHCNDMSSSRTRTPSSLYESVPLAEQHSLTGHCFSRSDTSEDTVDTEYSEQGREEIISETEEVFKNKVVVQASVVIMPEAWIALKQNRNLRKCVPSGVTHHKSFNKHNECVGIEVRGCWKSIDIVTSLAAEAWMASQPRGQLKEKKRQEGELDPEPLADKQQTRQKRNPKLNPEKTGIELPRTDPWGNSSHTEYNSPPDGLGREETSEQKHRELDLEIIGRENTRANPRGSGSDIDYNAAPAELGREEMTREKRCSVLDPETTKGQHTRIDPRDVRGYAPPPDGQGDKELTRQQRIPELDPPKSGKEHMSTSHKNAGSHTVTNTASLDESSDEALSGESDSSNGDKERTSEEHKYTWTNLSGAASDRGRNPTAKSQKRLPSDRRKNRTFSKLEGQTGMVFFTEKLILKVYEGDITSLSGVDCVVNSTDQHLRHGGGAALAIKRAAGPEFEKECSNLRQLDLGKCVSTRAGKLNYKKILHVTLPVWKSQDEKSCIAALQKSVEAALQKAEKEEMKSMALLGIGTGVQRFPIDKWVSAVVDIIKKYSKTKKPLAEIHFVDTKTDLLQHLKIALPQAFPRSTQGMLPPQEHLSQRPMSNGTSAQRFSSQESLAEGKPTKQGSRLGAGKALDYGMPAVFDISSSCKLVIDNKDIIKFNGDAIGVTDDRHMFGLSPLSRAVASAAGESYIGEKMKKRYNYMYVKIGDIIVTKAGDLHCEYILHGICDIHDMGKPEFSSLVRSMLSKASHLKVKKLAIPALCTASTRFKVREGCELLVNDICEFVKKNPQCTLTEINMLDIDKQKVEQLCQSISKLESARAVFRAALTTSQTSQLETPSTQGAARIASANMTSPVLSFSLPVTSTCQVTVQKKDLADFDGDAIVTGTRSVSQRRVRSRMRDIVSAIAGETYEKERRCHQPGNVIVTRARGLKCRFILVAIQDSIISKDRGKKEIKSLVNAALAQASADHLRTIAFPAIWEETGSSGFSLGEWLELLVAEICRSVQDQPRCSLEEIYILDTDEDTVQEIFRILTDHWSRKTLREPGRIAQGTHTSAAEVFTLSKNDLDNAARHKQDVVHGNQPYNANQVCYICSSRERNQIHTCECGRQMCIKCKVNLHRCSLDQNGVKATKTIPVTEDMHGEKNQTEALCTICLSTMKRPKVLHCGHMFCKDCIEQCFHKGYKLCPVCKAVCGVVTGNQPKGTMNVSRTSTSCDGYGRCGSLVIDYIIPDGIQEDCHPNPGKYYKGLRRTAYLPDNREGNKVLKDIQQAFNQQLVFTIGRSVTTGREDVVTWNDIHHKTAQRGGPEKFGYPDPGYLRRVQEELQAKGIGGSSHEGSPV